MILHQFYLNCLAHASYLVGDERSRIAAVVDPQRDIDQYLAFAERARPAIAHVLLTHFHADFIAGHLELRDRVGATIYLGAAAKAEYAFTPLADGDRIEFGHVRLQALETPGHTPESISHPGLRSRSQRYGPARRADRRHAVCRRRRPAGSARRAGLVGGRSRRHAVRLAAHQAAARCPTAAWSIRRTAPARSAARRSARKRCRRSASSGASNYALQPMTKARVRRARHGGSARRAAVFHLRRGAEQQGAADARRGARARAESDDARSGAGAAGRRRPDARHARSGASSRPRICRQHQHRPRRPVRDLGGDDPRAASARS